MLLQRMLSERTLIRVSLAASILGILALYLILLTAELPVAQLTAVDAQAARTEATVRVRARIMSVRHAANGTVTLLTLAEEVERPAVVFAALNLTPGTEVDVEGTVQLYRDEPELVVTRLSPAGASS